MVWLTEFEVPRSVGEDVLDWFTGVEGADPPSGVFLDLPRRPLGLLLEHAGQFHLFRGTCIDNANFMVKKKYYKYTILKLI